MATTQLQMRQKKNRDLLDESFNIKENTMKVNMHNTPEHELAKFLLLWELRNNGDTLVVEAIFKTGHRADIFSLDEGMAYEILHTETEERFKEKTKNYPCPIMPLRAEKVIKQNLKRMMKQ